MDMKFGNELPSKEEIATVRKFLCEIERVRATNPMGVYPDSVRVHDPIRIFTRGNCGNYVRHLKDTFGNDDGDDDVEVGNVKPYGATLVVQAGGDEGVHWIGKIGDLYCDIMGEVEDVNEIPLIAQNELISIEPILWYQLWTDNYRGRGGHDYEFRYRIENQMLLKKFVMAGKNPNRIDIERELYNSRRHPDLFWNIDAEIASKS